MRVTLWLAALATTAMLAFSCVPGMATNDNDTTNALKRFSNTLELVEKGYVHKISKAELIDKALRGMLQSLDPHTVLMNPEDTQSMDATISGEFFGVGVQIAQDESGALRVIAPIEDTPGWRAGIKANDLILEVDGMSTQDMTLTESISHIKGPKGTEVVLTILPAGEQLPIKKTIVRDAIPLHSVKTMELDDGYLYVRITNFSLKTADELHEKLADFTSKKEVKGLVLDLRSNPGGALNAATDVADAFLREGTIVSIKSRTNEVPYVAKDQSSDITAPMVVLIDAGSASASEIVAGALRDHKRALLVGERSFGKGSVQNIFPQPDGSSIKMTIALYYTPNGTSIQAEGIEPDILLPFAPPQEESTKSVHLNIRRESSLSGHLSNGNSHDPKEEKKDAKALIPNEETQKRLKRDNQLRMALQLVRSMPRIQALH